MKVIENNYNPKQENIIERIICEHCNSVFEIEKEDCQIGEFGGAYVNCPCCGGRNLIDEYSVDLNTNNLTFPIHYNHVASKNEGTFYIDDERINNWIKDTLKWFEQNPDEPFKYTATGDTCIFVFNHEDEYWIVVTKDYYEVDLDK